MQREFTQRERSDRSDVHERSCNTRPRSQGWSCPRRLAAYVHMQFHDCPRNVQFRCNLCHVSQNTKERNSCAAAASPSTQLLCAAHHSSQKKCSKSGSRCESTLWKEMSGPTTSKSSANKPQRSLCLLRGPGDQAPSRRARALRMAPRQSDQTLTGLRIFQQKNAADTMAHTSHMGAWSRPSGSQSIRDTEEPKHARLVLQVGHAK